jgi:hypothetical protein
MGRTGGRQKRFRGDYELALHKSISEKKKNDGTPYSERSVDTFVNNIQKLSRNFLGKEEIMTSLKWLEDSKRVIRFIQTHKTSNGYPYSLQTQWSFIQSIIIGMNNENYTEEHLKPYWDERDIIKAKLIVAVDSKDAAGTNTSLNQLKVMSSTTEQDVFDMVDKMNEASFDKDGKLVNRKLLMIATIIAVHSEFPFRNDLADVKIIGKKRYEAKVKSGEDKGFNWLIIHQGHGQGYQFILNEYKTKAKYGMIVGDVETPLVKEQLTKWIRDGHFGDEMEDTYLFTNEEGRALTRNNISVLLTTETKKYTGGSPISTTLLVKIFNDVPQDYKEITLKDALKLKKKAYLRGHALQTRITHYSKKR